MRASVTAAGCETPVHRGGIWLQTSRCTACRATERFFASRGAGGRPPCTGNRSLQPRSPMGVGAAACAAAGFACESRAIVSYGAPMNYDLGLHRLPRSWALHVFPENLLEKRYCEAFFISRIFPGKKTFSWTSLGGKTMMLGNSATLAPGRSLYSERPK